MPPPTHPPPRQVFVDGLFAVPSATTPRDSPPPKCKNVATRKLAFTLLAELAKDCEANYHALCALVMPHHQVRSPRAHLLLLLLLLYPCRPLYFCGLYSYSCSLVVLFLAHLLMLCVRLRSRWLDPLAFAPSAAFCSKARRPPARAPTPCPPFPAPPRVLWV